MRMRMRVRGRMRLRGKMRGRIGWGDFFGGGVEGRDSWG